MHFNTLQSIVLHIGDAECSDALLNYMRTRAHHEELNYPELDPIGFTTSVRSSATLITSPTALILHVELIMMTSL